MDVTTILELLEIEYTDNEEIRKVEIVHSIVEDAIRLYINEPSIPAQLEWIVTELTIKRYHLLEAEHLSGEGADVISYSYKDGNILEEYTDLLDTYIDNQTHPTSKLNKMKMI